MQPRVFRAALVMVGMSAAAPQRAAAGWGRTGPAEARAAAAEAELRNFKAECEKKEAERAKLMNYMHVVSGIWNACAVSCIALLPPPYTHVFAAELNARGVRGVVVDPCAGGAVLGWHDRCAYVQLLRVGHSGIKGTPEHVAWAARARALTVRIGSFCHTFLAEGTRWARVDPDVLPPLPGRRHSCLWAGACI